METGSEPFLPVTYKIFPTRLSSDRAIRGSLVINTILYFLAFIAGYTVAGLPDETVWAETADRKKIVSTRGKSRCFSITRIGLG
jgi:hypothetical protein